MEWKLPAQRRKMSRRYTGTESVLSALPGESRPDDTARQVRRIIEALALTAPTAPHLESVAERLAWRRTWSHPWIGCTAFGKETVLPVTTR
jgi:hypothetical protein